MADIYAKASAALERSTDLRKRGTPKAARTPMITMTTANSTRVKAPRFAAGCCNDIILSSPLLDGPLGAELGNTSGQGGNIPPDGQPDYGTRTERKHLR